jgi:hypothetical protein
MVKRAFVSLFGMILSIIGVVGVLFSQLMFQMFLSVITAISGLFTLAVHYNDL